MIRHELGDFATENEMRRDFEQIFSTYGVDWFDIIDGPSNLRFNDDDFERFYCSDAEESWQINIRIPVKDNFTIAH